MVDLSLMNILSPIIIFILIWALTYALLTKSKVLGDNQNLNAVISFAVAVLFILIPGTTKFVSIFTPWIMVLFIGIVLLFSLFYFIGWDFKSIQEHLGAGVIVWTIIIIFLIILFVSLSNIFGEKVAPYSSADSSSTISSTIEGAGGSLGSEVKDTLFNPKVLGVIFLLMVAVFAIRLISESQK